MEEIFGYVEEIVFSSESFTVLKLKELRKRELTCIVGLLPTLQPGETVRCVGSWKHHPQHGRQFQVELFESKAPSDLIGIQKYLESGPIKGIGPAYAEKIVRRFGVETLQMIDTENLNMVLQKQFHQGRPFLNRMGRLFCVGDKVMQIRKGGKEPSTMLRLLKKTKHCTNSPSK